MNLKNRILTLAERYCAAKDVSEARVATLIFNQGGTIKRLRAGGDLTTRKFEFAIQWFSDHWPDGEPWPVDIPRPASPAQDAAA